MAELTILGISNPTEYPYDYPIHINNPRKVTVSANALYRELVVEVYPYVYNPSLPLLRLLFYTDRNNNISFDICEIIKSIFKSIQVSNIYEIDMQNTYNVDHYTFVFRTDNPNISITEVKSSFIRGGVNSLVNPLSQSFRTSLNISNNNLYWKDGNELLPSASYSYSRVTGDIIKTTITETTERALRMPIKSCNYTYIKFLNHLGGFSYWLFESAVTNIKSSNIGCSINYSDVVDYGVEVENDLILTTKVDREYLPILKSLIYSPYILVYSGNLLSIDAFSRVVLQNNTIVDDPASKSVFVSIKLNQVHNYNPSVIW